MYITKLPEAEDDAAEWQAAMETLILVATSGGPTMMARIGIERALNRHVERVFNPDRKDTHWGKAEAEEGSVMKTVWIYVDSRYRVGHPDHLKVFADPEAAADEWFKANDPEGVAFEYEVLE